MYVRDDLSVQKIRPRNRCFASVTEANEQLNETEDTYAGQTVMVKDEMVNMLRGSFSKAKPRGFFLLSLFTLSRQILFGKNFKKVRQRWLM